MKETTDVDTSSYFSSFLFSFFFQVLFLFVSFISENFSKFKRYFHWRKKWNYSVTYYCPYFREQWKDSNLMKVAFFIKPDIFFNMWQFIWHLSVLIYYLLVHIFIDSRLMQKVIVEVLIFLLKSNLQRY